MLQSCTLKVLHSPCRVLHFAYTFGISFGQPVLLFSLQPSSLRPGALHGHCRVPLLEEEIWLAIRGRASFPAWSHLPSPLPCGPSQHEGLAGWHQPCREHEGTCSLAMSGVSPGPHGLPSPRGSSPCDPTRGDTQQWLCVLAHGASLSPCLVSSPACGLRGKKAWWWEDKTSLDATVVMHDADVWGVV